MDLLGPSHCHFTHFSSSASPSQERERVQLQVGAMESLKPFLGVSNKYLSRKVWLTIQEEKHLSGKLPYLTTKFSSGNIYLGGLCSGELWAGARPLPRSSGCPQLPLAGWARGLGRTH